MNVKLIENKLNKRFLEFEKIGFYYKENVKRIIPSRDEIDKGNEQKQEIEKMKMSLANAIKFIELHKDELSNEIN